jgi:hypothetical protein
VCDVCAGNIVWAFGTCGGGSILKNWLYDSHTRFCIPDGAIPKQKKKFLYALGSVTDGSDAKKVHREVMLVHVVNVSMQYLGSGHSVC